MNRIKLYEQFDFEDLSDEELFGKKTAPEVGDRILILDTLRYYVIRHEWDKNMLEIIGKETYITEIYHNKYYIREGWYVYRDCFEII